MATRIHSMACVEPGARLGEDVDVAPFAVIQADAQIGDRCRVGSHAVVSNGTRMGCDNVVFPGAYVGSDSQDMKYRGEQAALVIGDRNVIREAATLNRATGEGLVTRVGDDNLIMAYAHVAHNCAIANHVILANSATLAGWVTVDDFAIIGGLSAVHQFCRIGKHAIIGGKTKVTKDVPPFLLADGHPAHAYGLNVVGLRRRNFSSDTLRDLRAAYKILYNSSLLLQDALAQIQTRFPHHPQIADVVSFIAASERSIIRPRPRAQRKP